MNGILMTSDNHKAIRDKLKTQTRRLDHLKEINEQPDLWTVVWVAGEPIVMFKDDIGGCMFIQPRYRIGETVYIKEAHYLYGAWAYLTADQDKPLPQREWRFVQDRDYPVKYLENPPDRIERNRYGGRGWYLRSPLFLPKKFARTFIKITDVRPERLKNITLEDAYDEGIDTVPAYDRIDAFKRLWNSINKPYPFDGNYWVWRICFNLIKDKR